MDLEKIKEKCAEIAKAFSEGKTPQEIADMFQPEHVWDDNDDPDYVYYMTDFLDLGFGINFVKYASGGDKWWWENDDEIYLIESEEWIHWKEL